ncbi:uncharacterized protein LOC141849013 isoform X2 [Brevipalpus obovatus]|uniref:uncharacterized protein LOC141849013 isoform X2 n=1 Tax=Brevipalpus obovatus TaxID=246614 RepID=UPI003D9F9CDA
MSSSPVSSVLSVSSCQVSSGNNNKDKGFQGGGGVSPYTWDSNSIHHNNINNINNNNNNSHNNKNNNNNINSNNNNLSKSCLTKVRGILRESKQNITTSTATCKQNEGNSNSNMTRKGSVRFIGDPIVIGYCDESDSGNEEDDYEEVSSSSSAFSFRREFRSSSGHQPNGDTNNDTSEEDSEFAELTRTNTRFNSNGANLKDSSHGLSHGQMNGKSINAISFKICDFKSECKRSEQLFPTSVNKRYNVFNSNSNTSSNNINSSSGNGNGSSSEKETKNGVNPSKLTMKSSLFFISDDNSNAVSSSSSPTTTVMNGKGKFRPEWASSEIRSSSSSLLTPSSLSSSSSLSSLSPTTTPTITSTTTTTDDIVPTEGGEEAEEDGDEEKLTSSPTIATLSHDPKFNQEIIRSAKDNSSSTKTKLTPCITSKSVSSSNAVIEVSNDKETPSSSLSSSSPTSPSTGYHQTDSCTINSHEKMKKEHETTFNNHHHNNNTDKKMGIKMFVSSSHLSSTSPPTSTCPSSSQSILSPSFVLNGEENNSTQAAGSTKNEKKPLDEVQSESNGNNNGNHNNNTNANTNVKNSSCNGGSMQQVKLIHKSMYDQANESVTLIGYDHVDSEERVDKEWRKRAGRDASLPEQQQELNGCQDELGMNSVNKLPNSFEFGKSEHITTASAIITSRTVNLESENNGDTVSGGGGGDGKKISSTTIYPNDELGSRSEEDASIINELSSVTKDDKVPSSSSSPTITTTSSITSKMETPCKPERCAKSSKPKIPSKPISLSSNFKKLTQSSESNSSATTSTSSINSPTDDINGDISDDKETHRPNHPKENSNLINAPIDASPESKVESKCTNKQQQIGNSSNRELRLAELAQELEKSRHWKGPAPPPPANTTPSSGSSTASSRSSSSERPVKFNTISRAGTSSSSRGSGGSTKFSLKKLLKFSKDDHDIDNSSSGKPLTGKIWKQKFEINPRHSSDLAHPDEISERQLVVGRDSKSASYETHAPRDRIYSLSSPPPPPPPSNGSQPLTTLPPRTESSTRSSTSPSTGLQRPAVPARRSRQSDGSSARVAVRPSKPVADHAPAKPRHSLGSPEDAKLMTTTSVNFNRSPNVSSVDNIIDENVDYGQRKLSLDSSSSTCGVMLSSLSIESAYSIMAKYNNETLSQIMQNCFTTKKPIHTLPRENLNSLSQDQQFTCFTSSEIMFYRESSMQKILLTGDADQSVNFMVTPSAYGVRSEGAQDFLIDQFILSDKNGTENSVGGEKLFVLKSQFNLVYSLNQFITGDIDQLLAGSALNLKKCCFIILQIISLLEYYQANGIDELEEKQLHMILLFFRSSPVKCSNGLHENNVYVMSPSFEYLKSKSKESSQSSVTLSTSFLAYSMFECIRRLVQNLQKQMSSSDSSVMDKIISQSKVTQSLSIAKALCEALFFEVPLNLKNQTSLDLWLDIQRTKLINVFNKDSQIVFDSKTVYFYYCLLFFTRSDSRTLFQSINQLKDASSTHQSNIR